MDIRSLFGGGVSTDGSPLPAETTIVYGTAVADSSDGTVLVEMDGDAVTQPAQESTTATIAAERFQGGTVTLPSEPFPGSVVVYAEEEGEDSVLPDGAYQVNGDQLTIEALVGGEPVGVAWETHVRQAVTNDDFVGGAVQLVGEPSDLSVLEDVGGAEVADWQPVAYTLDGDTLTVAGMEPADGRVVATYVRTVEIVTDAGEQVLPDMPAADDVAVIGRTTDATNPPVEAVVTGWDLAGDLITIPDGYDTYTVTYSMPEAEEWNLTDQTDDEPLPDYDPGWDGGAQGGEELEPEAVTVGHVLAYEPDAGTLAVTVDGTPAAYALDVQTVIVAATPATVRHIAIEYDAAQAMELTAAEFGNGPVDLPTLPNDGTVAVEVGGVALDPAEYSVIDRSVSVPALVADVSQYVVTYAEQVPVAAVELPTSPAVSEGDVVQVAVVGGVPSVIAVQGSGDSALSVAVDAADLAGTASDDAEESLQRVETAELNITSVETSIQQLDDKIQSEVYARGVAEDAIYDTISTVTQSADELTIQLSQLSSEVQDAASETSEAIGVINTRLDASSGYVDELRAYVSVSANEGNQPVLELGSNTWDVYAQLMNNRLQFMQGNTTVAYISDQELNVTVASVHDHIALGDWAWIPRSNGNLSLKWIGGAV